MDPNKTIVDGDDFQSLESIDENVQVIQWHGLFSVVLILILSICGILSTVGKSMIIYFIVYKAPNRPLNFMILCNQVSTYTSQK